MMKSPIFILGANRSGTTLLRLILNAHSRIAIPEEVDYFNSNFAKINIKKWKNPNVYLTQYHSLLSGFLSRNHETFKEIDTELLKSEAMKSNIIDFRQPYQMALEAWARHHGKQRWGEKTPGNLFYVDILFEMFPDAKFIHIVRDPRAVVHSMNEHDFSCFPEDSVINALNWRRIVSRGCELLEKFVPVSQRMTIRYEDLVTSPEEQIATICEFIDEPFEIETLQFHANAKRYMKQTAISVFNAAATQPISQTKVDRWKNKLSSYEVAAIELICRKEMALLGYKEEGEVLSLWQSFKVFFTSLSWKVYCWRNRRFRGYLMSQIPSFLKKYL